VSHGACRDSVRTIQTPVGADGFVRPASGEPAFPSVSMLRFAQKSPEEATGGPIRGRRTDGGIHAFFPPGITRNPREASNF